MPKESNTTLTFYSAYCFFLSPTYNTWARLTAADVCALRERAGFEGQNLYFHLNHPIRWVRLVGVVVAFDVLPTRFIFVLDDSSGTTIDVTCELAKAQSHDGRTHELSKELAMTEIPTKGVTAKGGEVNLAGVDIGSVVKVKGGIGAWKGRRQVLLERISTIHTTAEEVEAWTENSVFRRDILDKPWIVDEKEEKRAKRRAEGKDRPKRLQPTKMRRELEESTKENMRRDLGDEDGSRHSKLVKEDLRKKDKREREKELEKQRLQRLEKEKEVRRRKLENEATRELEKAEMVIEQERMQLQKQRELEEQRRKILQAEREREQVKRKRDAERAERERIFKERMGASKVYGYTGGRKQSRKERRTDQF